MIIEVDNTAWASGIWTTGITGVGAILTTPDGASIWLWLVGLIITGLFGMASSALTVLVKYWVSEMKERKKLKGKD